MQSRYRGSGPAVRHTQPLVPFEKMRMKETGSRGEGGRARDRHADADVKRSKKNIMAEAILCEMERDKEMKASVPSS